MNDHVSGRKADCLGGLRSDARIALPFLPVDGLMLCKVPTAVESCKSLVESAEREPVDLDLYKDYVQRTGAQRDIAAAEFTARAIHTAGTDNKIPKSSYPKLCYANMCRRSTDNKGLLELASSFRDCMSNFVAEQCKLKPCKPHMMIWEEFMFSFEVSRPPTRSVVCVGQMTLANKLAGVIQASQSYQSFHWCDASVSRDAPVDCAFRFANLEIEPSHVPHVEVHRLVGKGVEAKPWHLESTVGALDVLTLDELTVRLTREVQALTLRQRKSTSIIVTLMAHERVAGFWSRRVVRGVDGRWGPKQLFFDPRRRRDDALVDVAASSDDDDFAIVPAELAPQPALVPLRQPQAAGPFEAGSESDDGAGGCSPVPPEDDFIQTRIDDL